MAITRFFNIPIILVGHVAGLFFCIGSSRLRAVEIISLSGTKWGHNNLLHSFLVI
jgi:hypothetical protein